MEQQGAVHAGADEEVAFIDRAAVIRNLIAKLPEAQQEAVHLAFYKGLTQREIARFTDKPLGTIKTRLELGLRKLRTSLLALGEFSDGAEQVPGA
jgi:RNA polymerase sigma-70 factor (ECF subfamily)